MDDIEKEQNLFVRAFAGISLAIIHSFWGAFLRWIFWIAEPTEIYRRLAEYRRKHVSFNWSFELVCSEAFNWINPNLQPLQLFLHRNLSYVRFRKWRPKKVKRRSCGKMHSISLTADKLVEQKRGAKHYMTFTFHGFYCNDVTVSKQFAEVELTHKETNTMVRLTLHRFSEVESQFSSHFAVDNNHCGHKSGGQSLESAACD